MRAPREGDCNNYIRARARTLENLHEKFRRAILEAAIGVMAELAGAEIKQIGFFVVSLNYSPGLASRNNRDELLRRSRTRLRLFLLMQF